MEISHTWCSSGFTDWLYLYSCLCGMMMLQLEISRTWCSSSFTAWLYFYSCLCKMMMLQMEISHTWCSSGLTHWLYFYSCLCGMMMLQTEISLNWCSSGFEKWVANKHLHIFKKKNVNFGLKKCKMKPNLPLQTTTLVSLRLITFLSMATEEWFVPSGM